MEVLAALREYQNADKGFGNALEPDLRCKESSALATTVALQYLSRITTDDKLELVKEIFEYLSGEIAWIIWWRWTAKRRSESFHDEMHVRI